MSMIVLEGRRYKADHVPLASGELDVRVKRAIRGSRRLRDAIWRLQGYSPPKKVTRHEALRKDLCSCHALGQPRMLIANIQATVATYYSLPLAAMTSNQQYRQIAHPRQVAMFLANELTQHSLAEIGRRFRRDHTTVMYAIKAVRQRMTFDPQTEFDVEALRERLAV
jgi:chromosomal replication initiation ATPase DnaA